MGLWWCGLRGLRLRGCGAGGLCLEVGLCLWVAQIRLMDEILRHFFDQVKPGTPGGEGENFPLDPGVRVIISRWIPGVRVRLSRETPGVRISPRGV